MSSSFEEIKKNSIYFNPLYVRTAKELDYYRRLEYEIKYITGYDLETLKRLFAAGFTLKRPEYEVSIDTITDYLNKGVY